MISLLERMLERVEASIGVDWLQHCLEEQNPSPSEDISSISTVGENMACQAAEDSGIEFHPGQNITQQERIFPSAASDRPLGRRQCGAAPGRLPSVDRTGNVRVEVTSSPSDTTLKEPAPSTSEADYLSSVSAKRIKMAPSTFSPSPFRDRNSRQRALNKVNAQPPGALPSQPAHTSKPAEGRSLHSSKNSALQSSKISSSQTAEQAGRPSEGNGNPDSANGETTLPTQTMPVICSSQPLPSPLTQDGGTGEKRMVWIVGHSFIYWAERRAAYKAYFENLDINTTDEQILWSGIKGLSGANLFSTLSDLCSRWPLPNILIIHVGGDDIGKMLRLELVHTLKSDLLNFKKNFPNTVVVYSEIIPRPAWLNTPLAKQYEKIRKRINRAMEKFLPEIGGFSLRHINLEGGEDGLYRQDGVHLSDIGLDILNKDFQECIEKAKALGDAGLL
ncbi:uncharacterized protein ACMZJ9_014352 [Mantella aurantiaca]